MAENPPPRPGGSPRGEPAPEGDPLEELRAQLHRAEQAAQRLAQEASQAAASAPRRPPPAGWQQARAADRDAGDELAGLVALLGALRGLVPGELQEQLASLVRELLLALRALIDLYLARLGRRPDAAAGEVQDIPIG